MAEPVPDVVGAGALVLDVIGMSDPSINNFTIWLAAIVE
jgi:hypothetical protein